LRNLQVPLYRLQPELCDQETALFGCTANDIAGSFTAFRVRYLNLVFR
jgi:hypothetical protein